MELYKDEYKIFESNSIHIGDVSITKYSSSSQRTMITVFHSIEMGANIQVNKAGNITKLNMDRMKKKMILITINKSECYKSSSGVQILNTRLGLQNKKEQKVDYVGSGVVVLMMAIKIQNRQRLFKIKEFYGPI